MGYARAPLPLLVVSAFPPELEGFRDRLETRGEGLEGRAGRFQLRARAVGIGLVEAAAGTVSAIAALEAPPAAVVFVGTCGVYPSVDDAPPVGSVVVACEVRLVDPASEERRAALPAAMGVKLLPDAALVDGLGARRVGVATTLAITTDDALATHLARSTGLVAEHLEAYAVGRACERAGVRFAAALGVANVVGSRARAQWQSHHEAAGRAAARHVLGWLDAGAPGL